MLALIHAGWVRPPTEGEVQAVLSFTVGRKGEISDLEVAQTSGFTAFDLAALRAVDNASPLPPLPASYRRDSLRVTLIVH
jgi:TonB family protein